MARIAICLLSLAAVVSSLHLQTHPLLVPAGLANPLASGYIYRSDNDGPASLIQLGAHGYSQPRPFAPPLPLPLAAQPLFTNLAPIQPALNSYRVVEPTALLSQPILVADAEDDSEEDSEEDSDEAEDSEEYSEGDDDGDFNDDYAGDAGIGYQGRGVESGGGSSYNDASHSGHGERGGKGYNSNHYSDKGETGHHDREGHSGFYQKGAGEKGSHFDEADAHGAHHNAANAHKGESFGHKKSHSKGEKTDGYHKVYHKDEYKKDTDFYDEADKSGHFNKHGYYKNRHGSSAGGHKKAGKHSSGHEQGDYGKSGHHAKGHHEADDSGYSGEEGGDSYHNHHEDYAKKGGDSNGKAYGYSEH